MSLVVDSIVSPARPLHFVLAAALTLVACTPHVPPATAAQRAEVRVVLYTTRWCPVCNHARSWLSARGIPYQERDVETSPAAAATHRRLNGARTVPVIDVEGRILIGFVAEELRYAVDEAAHRITRRGSAR